jgi:D-amino peptidase
MRVFLLTDIEGVAGVVSFKDQTFADSKYYDNAKKLLTAEVNAGVEGFLAQGATEVLVVDGHGAGGIWFEDLHPEAKLLHGRPITLKQILGTVVEYDVAAIIGQHAMAGVPTSNMNHTQDSRGIDHYMLNGKKIGEIAQFSLYAGAHGVPMIFLSGEEAACQEAGEFIPGITTACVKKGLGRGSAISLSAVKAREVVRKGAEEAMINHKKKPVKPLVWKGPFVLEKRFFSTDAADADAMRPGATRVDGQTVRYESKKVLDVIYR